MASTATRLANSGALWGTRHPIGIPSLLAFALLLTSGVQAQTPDQQFVELVTGVCNDSSVTNPSQALIDLCGEVLFGGGSGPGGAVIAQDANTNLGGSAAAGRSAETIGQRRRSKEQTRDDEQGDRRAAGEVRGAAAGGSFGLGPVSLFIGGLAGETDRRTTALESGFDADLRGLTASVSVAPVEGSLLGIAIGRVRSDAALSGGGGEVETRSTSLSLFGAYGFESGLYVRGYLGGSRQDFDSSSNVIFLGFSDTVRADYEGDQRIGGVSVGYDRYVGPWTFGAAAGLDLSLTEIDGYQETDSGTALAQFFRSQHIRSLESSVGALASYTFGFGWGTLTPEVRGTWVHEFDGDARVIETGLAAAPQSATIGVVTDRPDRDYLRWSAGLIADFDGGTQAFTTFERNEGHRFLDEWSLSAGVLFSF
jgi:outer membrane autotransporter protein